MRGGHYKSGVYTIESFCIDHKSNVREKLKYLASETLLDLNK